MKLGAGLRMALTGGSSSPSSSFAAKVIHIILFAMSCGKASIKLIKPSHSRMKGGHNRRGGNITSYIYIYIYISYHLPNAINLWGMVYEVRMDKPSRCRRGLCAKGQEKNGFHRIPKLGVASWPWQGYQSPHGGAVVLAMRLATYHIFRRLT